VLRIGDRDFRLLLRAEGAHNAQNAAGAAALALTLGFTPDDVAEGLRKVSPAFGRGQSFDVEGRRLTLQLVKNPAGFRQTLRTLDHASPAAIVIAINDEYADGRDVSWLWDVDFVPTLHGRATRLSTSGTRAADMAVRLRYDDISVVEVEPDLEKAVRQAVAAVDPGAQAPTAGPGASDGTVVVFSTYTAMWALHAILLRIGEPA
jgi:UDP-N-acetylmuramyl tripeptide synthase